MMRVLHQVTKAIVLAVLCVSCFSFTAKANTVEEVISPYGFKAWVIEDHSLPIVSIHMAFKKAGTAYDPEGKQGLAFMVRSLLDEGAGDMDSVAFKQALDRYAIHLQFETDEDNFYVSMKTLKEHLPGALSLFKLALTAPRFDDDAVERVRNQIHAYIIARKEDPETQAEQAFSREIFGAHPYGNIKTGTEATLAAITKEDLQQFTQKHFTRVPLVISAVGDIQPKELAGLLDTYFINLPLTTDNNATLEEFSTFPSGKERSINMAVPQSTVIFGLKGVKRDDKDFYAAFVLNYILGGGSFSSRLMEEVREKKGLAYTVGTSLEVFNYAGLLRGYVASENAKIHESIAIIKEVFKQVQEKGVTQQELDDAKSYLIGSFPLGLDKNEKLAAYLIGMQLENLGKDFLEKRNSYIQNVTLEDVNRVAKNIILPDNLITIIVGDTQRHKGKKDVVISARH